MVKHSLKLPTVFTGFLKRHVKPRLAATARQQSHNHNGHR
jgi:hypothetical protein